MHIWYLFLHSIFAFGSFDIDYVYHVNAYDVMTYNIFNLLGTLLVIDIWQIS